MIIILIFLLLFFAFALVSGGAPEEEKFEKMLLIEYRRRLAIEELTNLEVSGDYKYAISHMLIYMSMHVDKEQDQLLYIPPRDSEAFRIIFTLPGMKREEQEKLLDKILDIIHNYLKHKNDPGVVEVIDIIEYTNSKIFRTCIRYYYNVVNDTQLWLFRKNCSIPPGNL